ncbi:MAG: hypothetical protein IPL33_17970 [Sphingobacteriales bacterium]|nr:hypothetical protein [Sphingobacteriales bacterium]MCC7223872.1 hypothetical protein [Chitinophagales bacterium]
MPQTTITHVKTASLDSSPYDEATYSILIYAIHPLTQAIIRFSWTDADMIAAGCYSPHDLIGKTIVLDAQDRITNII